MSHLSATIPEEDTLLLKKHCSKSSQTKKYIHLLNNLASYLLVCWEGWRCTFYTAYLSLCVDNHFNNQRHLASQQTNQLRLPNNFFSPDQVCSVIWLSVPTWRALFWMEDEDKKEFLVVPVVVFFIIPSTFSSDALLYIPLNCAAVKVVVSLPHVGFFWGDTGLYTAFLLCLTFIHKDDAH